MVHLVREAMPPFWPFKKKQVITELHEAPPAPVVYKRGEDLNARKSIETDTGAYKDALALFGGGSADVKAASDQSVLYEGATSGSNGSQSDSNEPIGSFDKEEPSMQATPSFTWIHHTDGYYYKQLAGGGFEPTPHVKNADGTYAPYS